MFLRVVLVVTDVSEKLRSFIIRATRIGELGATKYFVFLRSVCRLLVTANVVPSSTIRLRLQLSITLEYYVTPHIATRWLHIFPKKALLLFQAVVP
jgi:hypothetical protein